MKVPRYKFKNEMAICEICKNSNHADEPSAPVVFSIYYYNEKDTEAEILDSTLEKLGLPPLHVVRMFDEEENEYYVEMTGDLARVMPNIFGDKEE